ncbi:hypothetical protein [Halonatronum saccharophilum]|uniref:hypothetical protein n=1 Tax=Halonatronum saccharophilum TaxID=150060 RepID=UPI0004B4DCA1|nr:hypothetical protein [Halonatronum saccharophilum]
MIYRILIIVLSSMLFGYLLGRKLGREEGLKEGILFTPIILRKRSLEEGKCTSCGREYFDLDGQS